MIDTHTHLFSHKFDADRDAAIQRALDAGVEQMYLPNIDAATVDPMLVLAKAYPGKCLPMLGLHPTSVGADYEEQLASLEARIPDATWAAIGEIGTDLYWSNEFWAQQQAAFLTQCGWAIELDLPIVVHCRNSIDETIDLVSPLVRKGLRGVFHCFTGSVAQARRLTDLGFYLGIGGVVTYKNAGDLPEVVREVPLDRLVLETDSPYLAPVPKRGRRNESAFLPYVAEVLGRLLDSSAAEVGYVTSANARALFGPRGSDGGIPAGPTRKG